MELSHRSDTGHPVMLTDRDGYRSGPLATASDVVMSMFVGTIDVSNFRDLNVVGRSRMQGTHMRLSFLDNSRTKHAFTLQHPGQVFFWRSSSPRVCSYRGQSGIHGAVFVNLHYAMRSPAHMDPMRDAHILSMYVIGYINLFPHSYLRYELWKPLIRNAYKVSGLLSHCSIHAIPIATFDPDGNLATVVPCVQDIRNPGILHVVNKSNNTYEIHLPEGEKDMTVIRSMPTKGLRVYRQQHHQHIVADITRLHHQCHNLKRLIGFPLSRSGAVDRETWRWFG